MKTELPTFDDLYKFLRQHYKYSRFEGMAGDWCQEYPEIVTKSSMEQLSTLGHGFISCHEAHVGNAIQFNCRLEIMNEDKPPDERIEYRHTKGHITHLF